MKQILQNVCNKHLNDFSISYFYQDNQVTDPDTITEFIRRYYTRMTGIEPTDHTNRYIREVFTKAIEGSILVISGVALFYSDSDSEKNFLLDSDSNYNSEKKFFPDSVSYSDSEKKFFRTPAPTPKNSEFFFCSLAISDSYQCLIS